MPYIVNNSVEGEAWINELEITIQWKNHKDLVRCLLAACDECLLVSPFMARNFGPLFDGVDLSYTSIELISTCAPRGDDQLYKPYALRDFGKIIKNSTGKWPTIGLNQKLHSKVYVFRENGQPFAGIVTSANLTENGLSKNSETGVLLQKKEQLLTLEANCRASLDYVCLAEWQIEKLCQAADIARRDIEPVPDREVGLHSLLNNYAAPSAGNRDTVLRSTARYFIKVSGVRDRPILPEDHRAFDQPHCQLTFAKEPKGINLGDCLLEVAVGGACFLSYYACASAVWEFTDQQKLEDPDHKRWPYYVYANNLSLNYGSAWFKEPIFYDDVVEEFVEQYPTSAVTKAGRKHFKGAMQMGHSYIAVTKEFGEFVRERIDKYQAS